MTTTLPVFRTAGQKPVKPMKTTSVDRLRKPSAGWAGVLLLSLVSHSAAQSWWEGDHALGDWNGLRPELEEKGFTLTGSYEGNVAGNLSGGYGRGWAYADNWDLAFHFDLEKLAGWRGASFLINGVDRNGANLSGNEVGNFYTIQQVFGGNTFFLYGLSLEQKFWDDKASLKVGRFAMNEIFASTPVYWLYMNNGFDGSPKSLFSTGAFTAYPGTSWAARLELKPTDEFRYLLGIFQVSDRTYTPSKHGMNMDIRGEDGVTVVSQWQWNPEFFKQPLSSGAKGTEMKGLPGHYWLGAYVSDWDFAKWNGSGSRTVDYGIYLHGDQMVWQESPGSDEGLSLWAAWVYQPNEDVQTLPWQVSGGAFYKGLLPNRPDDRLIFGAIHGWFSDDYARSVSATGGGSPLSESILELGYRIELTEFAYAMPEFQYIVRPGGTGDLEDAFVWGLRVGVTF
ncbi:MAG: carbohydrate porin [Verrucomicrobiaceae bacterium]|nr:MAG: carbohydrate porin [Verrucomicrobiaceae bacterium]